MTGSWLQSDRGQLDGKMTSVIITLVVASIIVYLGMQIMAVAPPTNAELNETREHFERYCEAEYGEDAEVYLANDAAFTEHNGFHCVSNEGTVHLNQIPLGVWDKWKNETVDHTYVTNRLEDPPGLIPFF